MGHLYKDYLLITNVHIESPRRLVTTDTQTQTNVDSTSALNLVEEPKRRLRVVEEDLHQEGSHTPNAQVTQSRSKGLEFVPDIFISSPPSSHNFINSGIAI